MNSILGFNSGLSLRADQLNAFSNISTGAITLTDGGTVDLGAARVTTATFNLSNRITALTLDSNDGAAFTVNAGSRDDTVTILGGVGGSVLNGGGGNDALKGSAGGDDLNGGAGADTLNGGGGGAGHLTGGTGADIFLFVGTDAFSGMAINDFSGITDFGGGPGEGDKMRFSGLGNGTYIGDAPFVVGNGFQNSLHRRQRQDRTRHRRQWRGELHGCLAWTDR